jgi:hypothetical protein
VRPHAPRVCLRADTDLSVTANFDRWAQRVDSPSAWTPTRPLPASPTAGRVVLAQAATQGAVPERDRADPGPVGEDHKARIVKEKGHLNPELNHSLTRRANM